MEFLVTLRYSLSYSHSHS